MLGQLQLATYAAVLLGFTAATSAGLWLSERTRLQMGEAELRAVSDLAAKHLMDIETEDADEVLRELSYHSNSMIQLWLEKADGTLVVPKSLRRPSLRGLVHSSMATNRPRTPGKANMIEVRGRDHLTIVDRKIDSGDWLWSSMEITELGESQTEFLGWMIVIWGCCLAGSLMLVTLLVRRITKPLQDLSERSAELTAEGLKTAALPVPRGPIELARLTRTYNDLIERLAWSWSQQRQFVSAVSHELQSPLILVSGSLKRVMRKAPDLDPALMQRLQDAQDETAEMQQLLQAPLYGPLVLAGRLARRVDAELGDALTVQSVQSGDVQTTTSFVDTGVYTRDRCFRVWGSTPHGDDDAAAFDVAGQRGPPGARPSAGQGRVSGGRKPVSSRPLDGANSWQDG